MFTVLKMTEWQFIAYLGTYKKDWLQLPKKLTDIHRIPLKISFTRWNALLSAEHAHLSEPNTSHWVNAYNEFGYYEHPAYNEASFCQKWIKIDINNSVQTQLL